MRLVATLNLCAQLHREHLGVLVGFGLDQLAHQCVELVRQRRFVHAREPTEDALCGRAPIHRPGRVRLLQHTHLLGVEREKIGGSPRLGLDRCLDRLHQLVQTLMSCRPRRLSADAFFRRPGATIHGIDIALDRFGVGRIRGRCGQCGNLQPRLRKSLACLVGQGASALQATLVALRPLHELGRSLGTPPDFLARTTLLVAPERSIPARPFALVRSRLIAVGALVAPLLLGLIRAPGRIEQCGNEHVFDRDRSAHVRSKRIATRQAPLR